MAWSDPTASVVAEYTYSATTGAAKKMSGSLMASPLPSAMMRAWFLASRRCLQAAHQEGDEPPHLSRLARATMTILGLVVLGRPMAQGTAVQVPLAASSLLLDAALALGWHW